MGAQIVGGYNPASWDDSTFRVQQTDEGRTAFLFNLTTSVVLRQKLTTDELCGDGCGYYQTYNGVWNGLVLIGPSFGYDDLWLIDTHTPQLGDVSSLERGWAMMADYGPGARWWGMNVFGNAYPGQCGDSCFFDVEALEVYTVKSARRR